MSLHIHLQSLRTPSRVLLENLTLAVPAGTVHTVMGPSGSGKSSLLAAVCGTLDRGLQFDGRISLNGLRIDTLPTPARRVGLLLQDDLLFAHMTVRENLLFAVPQGPKAQRREQVIQALIDIEARLWRCRPCHAVWRTTRPRSLGARAVGPAPGFAFG